MKSIRIAAVAALVLFAGAASAATKSPAYTDLTGCCGSIHKAEHEKAYQRSLQVPDRDRGKVLAETSCSMDRQSAPTSVDPRYRR